MISDKSFTGDMADINIANGKKEVKMHGSDIRMKIQDRMRKMTPPGSAIWSRNSR